MPSNNSQTDCNLPMLAEVSGKLPEIQHVMRSGRILPTQPGTKYPAVRSVIKGATRDIGVAIRGEREWPGCDWACRIDHPRLIVLDMEGPRNRNGLASMQELVNRYGPLPDGPFVATPSGGKHRWFLLPENLPFVFSNWCGVLPGIDESIKQFRLVEQQLDDRLQNIIFVFPDQIGFPAEILQVVIDSDVA
jgi:hypothetical protein